MSLSIEVGIQIRERRKRAGITQEDLAARAGVSTRTISDYERGKISTLSKISETLSAYNGDLAPPDHSQSLIPADTYSPQTLDTVHVLREGTGRYYLQVAGDRQRLDAICDLAKVLDEIPHEAKEKLIDALVRLLRRT